MSISQNGAGHRADFERPLALIVRSFKAPLTHGGSYSNSDPASSLKCFYLGRVQTG